MMGQRDKGRIIVGLDVGSARVSCVVGEINGQGLHIIGVGSHPSQGLRKGVVVNIEATVTAIQKAVEEAELMAGCDIKSVHVSISGGHIQSLSSPGVIAVRGKEVDQHDVDRVIEAAKAVAIPTDREVLHTLAQEFSVDGQPGILDPRGMTGVRLEAKVHIITAASTALQNLVKCCNRAGLDVAGIVLEPLAAAEAVLTPDEKDLGVLLIDFGGGTTDLAAFAGGTVRHTFVLPLGGINLTKDIAISLRTPDAAAEKIKKRHGTCLVNRISRDQTIEVPSTGGRNPRILSRQILGEIIEARVEEILSLVQEEAAKWNLIKTASAGVVLTGGSSLMEGVVDLTEQIFGLPTRLGYPAGLSGLTDVVHSPAFASAVGLVLRAGQTAEVRPQRIKLTESARNLSGLLDRLKAWFKEAF